MEEGQARLVMARLKTENRVALTAFGQLLTLLWSPNAGSFLPLQRKWGRGECPHGARGWLGSALKPIWPPVLCLTSQSWWVTLSFLRACLLLLHLSWTLRGRVWEGDCQCRAEPGRVGTVVSLDLGAARG